eukprot:3203591-Alexandrium_andersonii.AAC.1
MSVRRPPPLWRRKADTCTQQQRAQRCPRASPKASNNPMVKATTALNNSQAETEKGPKFDMEATVAPGAGPSAIRPRAGATA